MNKMKKTTIYIDENDFKMLKTNAFLNNCSISEIIRRGIKKVCSENPKRIVVNTNVIIGNKYKKIIPLIPYFLV